MIWHISQALLDEIAGHLALLLVAA